MSDGSTGLNAKHHVRTSVTVNCVNKYVSCEDMKILEDETI